MADNEKNSTKIMQEKFADKEMNKEQLESVAGGTNEQTKRDTYFLRHMLGNGACRSWSRSFEEDNWASSGINKEVVAAWKKVGVDAYINPVDLNQYSINGKQVSQGEAYRHAQKVLNKYVKDSDWMPKK